MVTAGHLRERGADESLSQYLTTSTGAPPRGAERTSATAGSSSPRSGHLRERGADLPQLALGVERHGAPPRARSGHRLLVRAALADRGTSASAERTSRYSTRCGSGSGAPPRARSGLPLEPGDPPELRGTSASAERTRPSCCRSSCATGHLRERGADTYSGATTLPGFGAPPRARSGQPSATRTTSRLRGTSASAERTASPARSWRTPTGHLRERGADCLLELNNRDGRGAPPRARSGPGPLADAVALFRGTSASAERTLVGCLSVSCRPGHLLERGADSQAAVRHPQPRGAPPRARSGRSLRPASVDDERGTSASAERTDPALRTGGPGPGHLRERGADSGGSVFPYPGGGAPPRARSGLQDPAADPVW